jgi:hypothetical protein
MGTRTRGHCEPGQKKTASLADIHNALKEWAGRDSIARSTRRMLSPERHLFVTSKARDAVVGHRLRETRDRMWAEWNRRNPTGTPEEFDAILRDHLTAHPLASDASLREMGRFTQDAVDAIRSKYLTKKEVSRWLDTRSDLFRPHLSIRRGPTDEAVKDWVRRNPDDPLAASATTRLTERTRQGFKGSHTGLPTGTDGWGVGRHPGETNRPRQNKGWEVGRPREYKPRPPVRAP